MMIKKEWKLKGLPSGKRHGREYLEQVLISEDGWPFAIVHCDTFYSRGDDKDHIYSRLLEGQEVTVEVTFDVIGTDTDDSDYDDPREEALTAAERNKSLTRSK